MITPILKIIYGQETCMAVNTSKRTKSEQNTAISLPSHPQAIFMSPDRSD